MEELSVLRQRKTELEQQLNGLQESRKQLMVQLESLMKMIKVIQIQPLTKLVSSNSNLFLEPAAVTSFYSVHFIVTESWQESISGD